MVSHTPFLNRTSHQHSSLHHLNEWLPTLTETTRGKVTDCVQCLECCSDRWSCCFHICRFTLPNKRTPTARSARSTLNKRLSSTRRVRMIRGRKVTEDMLPNRRVSVDRPNQSLRRRRSRPRRLLSDWSAPSARPESVRFSDVARPSSSELTQPRSQVDQSSETDTYHDSTRKCWDVHAIR